jgi:hypothetical protein
MYAAENEGVQLVLLSQKVAVSAPVESVFVEIHIGLGAEMNQRRTDDSESRFAGYVEGLASVIGHKDRPPTPCQANAFGRQLGTDLGTDRRRPPREGHGFRAIAPGAL